MSEETEKNDNRPRKIVKKKGGHGGHHGGAWKVAYADFVTAMMALFIVLWIVGQSKSTKEAIAGYFKDPSNFSKGGSPGGLQSKGSIGVLSKGGDPVVVAQQASQTMSPEGSEDTQKSPEDKEQDRIHLEEAAEQFRQVIQRVPTLQALQGQIRIEITSEGLRVQLIEGNRDSFFDLGSSRLKPVTRQLLAAIAHEVAKLPNQVVVEGHTDARPYSGNTGRDYSNWELSTDRANSARRTMEEVGLRRNQVSRVIGYADQHLFNPTDPLDTANRRISILVRYLAAPTEAPAPSVGLRTDLPANPATKGKS
ncbi:MAG: flagellar motor protein MotB [Candidatus Methylomirabilis oxygeniifera]|uniref:Outer membrane protein, OmpA/MotB family n=1 Tax=Methylomirabilis oxygeniifera TaxID=671143 RepID=D5MGE2_METO1|nr:MAG: flagellar motor protein MotB [Candidatus Methylomirabilis oxyfera]CBE68823.1 Outer membrane protein, OmpA/MotB family [Candidatus Methylomirabilis oxyfera]